MSELRNYREYRTKDKSDWPRGQWEDEPDKMQWIDDATGLDCLIVRNHFGALCGYVGVTEDHPWHGIPYSEHFDVPCDQVGEKGYCFSEGHEIQELIEVHGGLTFSDRCAGTEDETQHICHVPEPGRSDHVWWFGFDCGHAWDISPAMDYKYGYSPFADQTYKDVEFVKEQIRELAHQLVEVKA